MCVDNEKNEINKEDVEIFPSIIKIRKENRLKKTGNQKMKLEIS